MKPPFGDAAAFYHHLTSHLVPGPRSPLYFVPLLVLFATLLVPSKHLGFSVQRYIVLPMLYAIQLHVWIIDQSFDVISMNAMLSAFMLLGYHDVRKDFQKIQRIMPSSGIERKDSSVYDTPQLEMYPERLHARALWVVDLLSSIRLVDWHCPANARNNLPTGPWTDRAHLFYLGNSLKGVLMYLILYLTSGYVTQSPSFVKNPPQTTTMSWYLECFVFLAHLGAALALYNAFLPLTLSVIFAPFRKLRINPRVSPLCWPAHFGSPSSICNIGGSTWGLQAFWGVFWHQNMRYITAQPGIALAEAFRIQRGSKLRYFLIVFVSFLLSGIVHMGVIPPEPVNTSMSCLRLRCRLAMFFWLQPAGIAFEVVIMRPVFGAMQRRRFCITILKAATFSWAILFLALSSWWTVRPVGREMRWWDVHLVPLIVSRS